MSAYDDHAELRALRQQVKLLTRPRSAAEFLFDGLLDELPVAAEAGRLEHWQRCAETIAALIVSRERATSKVGGYMLATGPCQVEASMEPVCLPDVVGLSAP